MPFKLNFTIAPVKPIISLSLIKFYFLMSGAILESSETRAWVKNKYLIVVTTSNKFDQFQRRNYPAYTNPSSADLPLSLNVNYLPQWVPNITNSENIENNDKCFQNPLFIAIPKCWTNYLFIAAHRGSPSFTPIIIVEY